MGEHQNYKLKSLSHALLIWSMTFIHAVFTLFGDLNLKFRDNRRYGRYSDQLAHQNPHHKGCWKHLYKWCNMTLGQRNAHFGCQT